MYGPPPAPASRKRRRSYEDRGLRHERFICDVCGESGPWLRGRRHRHQGGLRWVFDPVPREAEDTSGSEEELPDSGSQPEVLEELTRKRIRSSADSAHEEVT